MQIRSVSGDTISGLLYRHLGREDDMIEKQLFELNSGLAAYGPVLPAGVTVTLPDVLQEPTKKAFRSWD